MTQSRSSLSLAWAVPVVLGLGAFACENQQKTTPSESTTLPAAKAPVAPAVITPPTTATREGLKPSQLDDAQIGAVLVALNQGESQEAEQVEPHVTAADVKAFAVHMKTAHSGMLDHAREAFTKEHLTPASNAVSERLDADAAAAMKSLGAMQGTALDDAYIKGQVKAHEGAALLLDDMLTAVKSAELRSVLETEHGQVEDHLSDALHTERTMRPAMASKDGAGMAKK